MPELPEVETIKRDLEKKILGLTIEKIFVYDGRVIPHKSDKSFITGLEGKTIAQIVRRAKALIIHFVQGDYLVVHLKMTGQLIYGNNLKKNENLKETKVVFRLSNGQHLNYNDQRLFGRLMWVKNLDEVSYLTLVGPEPLNGTFTTSWLTQHLKPRAVPIKVLLMDQHFVAGIGNIYASEILFDARIHPEKLAKRLTGKEVVCLHSSTQNVLKEAIKCRGTSMRNYRDASGEKGEFKNRIKVYGRENELCGVCQQSIKKIVQAGRSTFFCKECQK